MNPSRRVRLGFQLLGIIAVIGTVGFMIIDGASVFDAFYMVVITITTVGFSEVFDMSTIGRMWAVLLIVAGLGAALYTATAEVEYLVDLGAVRRRSKILKNIEEMSGHVIVCGFGRVGRAVVNTLISTGSEIVVVERNPERVKAAEELGHATIAGDATSNEILTRAGIGRAEVVIACVDADSDNLVIALSSKSIRPELRVVCRAHDTESERKLLLAGADGVVAPQAVGAERLAALAVQPELAQIFDVIVNGKPVEFHVEELDVRPGSVVDGRSLRESGIREDTGALVLAVEEQKMTMKVNPEPDHVLHAGDRIVLVGTEAQVDRAARFFGAQ